MKKIFFLIGICFMIAFCNCSRTIGVNRSSPSSQFKGIFSTKEIQNVNILKTDGTTVDAKNIRIFRDTTTWTDPKTRDKKGMHTSGIKQLHIKSPPLLEKLLFGEGPKPKKLNLRFINGKSIEVYHLLVDQDSTFWFLAATGERQMCPTVEIDRVTINKSLSGEIIGGAIGLVVGYAVGYAVWILPSKSPDFANGLGTAMTIGGAMYGGAAIGKAKSNDTYIFFDALSDSSGNKNNTY